MISQSLLRRVLRTDTDSNIAPGQAGPRGAPLARPGRGGLSPK
jgi:hypothetical protein